MSDTKGRGGWRPNSGRKLPPGATGAKKRYSVMLRPEALGWVRQQGGSAYVERLVEQDRLAQPESALRPIHDEWRFATYWRPVVL